MSPLFLVNWHRVNRHFRALMWVLAIALAVAIPLGTVRWPYHARGRAFRVATPHVVAGTIRPAQ